MKKALLLLALALQVLYVQAQFEKGKWMLGGQTNANLSQYNDIGNQVGARFFFRLSNLDLNIWAINFLNKEKIIGFGLYNTSSWSLNIPQTSQPNQVDRYGFYETYGVQFLYGKYHTLARNLYFFSSASVGGGIVNVMSLKNGYELKTNLRPFELTYVLKKRFVFQANLLQVNFAYSVVKNPIVSNLGESNLTLKTSFNPFNNSFSILYILNNKK